MESLKRLFHFGSETKKPVTGALSTQVNLKKVMPYGDQLNDGAIQISFTLPVDASPKAREAAKTYVEKMGLKDVHVATMEAMGMGFTFFVVFAKTKHAFDFSKVKVTEAKFQKMEIDQTVEFVREKVGRRLTVIGATTGSDAHTVGIDAILNVKGYAGDPGLERYECFRVVNLRSQVANDFLVRKAVEFKADAILVSKLVTQRDQHLEDLKDLMKKIKAAKGLPSTLVTVTGGPRLTHAQAIKLGYDAGFGPGTTPSEVASFIAQEFVKKSGKK